MSAITSLRYWPDALVPIFNGTAPSTEADFYVFANLLATSRKRGNEPVSANLTDKEEFEKCMRDFFESYCALTGVVKLSERVNALSKTRFMEAISMCNSGIFDDDEKNFLVVCALPIAIKATQGGCDLLENQECTSWIVKYLFAIANPEHLKLNVKAYRGLPIEKMRELSEKRALASEWFQYYPQEITKIAVVLLKEALLNTYTGIPSSDWNLNNTMLTYYHRYLELASEFRALDASHPVVDKNGDPYKRENAYWESLLTSLQVFIENAL